MSGMANGRVRKWNLRLLIWCALVFVATGFLLWGAWVAWGAPWFGNLSAADQAVGRATSALTTVGGLGGAVFLTVRYREHSLAERQEERDVIAAQRQALVDATRLLDSDVASTRIAGVTILAEIADTYRSSYRQQVVDILCGYLRTNHKDEEKGHDPAVESAIMNTIAAHLRRSRFDKNGEIAFEQSLKDEQLWCDCTFDFHNAVFVENVNFTNVIFGKSVNFSGTSFTDDAYFWGATFTGDAYFWGATFSGGAYFWGATFSGGAYFSGATFTGGAYFSGVTFSGVTFSGDSSFRQATFTCADFDMVKGNIKINEATGLPDGAVWKSTEDRS